MWLTVTTIILGLIFLSMQGLIFRHGSMEMDSWSYPSGWWSLKDGHIDPARPPVYCTIVGLIWEPLTMGYGNILLPVIQWTLYIASLQLVWIINGWLKANKTFNTLAILSMMLIPGFWIFNNIIMAESISLSGIILLVWLCGKYIRTKKGRYLWLSEITQLILIFTKPMFIFLIPVLTLLWIVVGWKNKIHLCSILLSLFITVSLLWWYTVEMKKEYGVAALTLASTHNRYCCLRADGAIIPDEISDPVIREKFSPMYEADPGVQNPENRYIPEAALYFTWPELDRLINETTKHHPYADVDGIFYRIKTSMTQSQHFFYLLGYNETVDRLFSKWNGISKNRPDGFIFPFHRQLWFPIWITALIWATFTLIWLYRWQKNHRFPAMAYTVSAIIFTCYISVIIGAQDQWGRIMTPVTPLIPVMASSIASISCGYVKKSLSGWGLKRGGFA